MNGHIRNDLELREVFHLEFLRWLGRKLKPADYALKGGANLRFFFKSPRYSEDLDLDIKNINMIAARDCVMNILRASSFHDGLKPFGIVKVAPPDISKAKQTETTQRFKAHLANSAGIDLFTKIEFSRRGFSGHAPAEPVSDAVLRAYRLPPLLVPHYDAESAMLQKIGALASRAVPQARDIFDIYMLIPQSRPPARGMRALDHDTIKKSCDSAFSVSFGRFRDTVLNYLRPEEQSVYDSASAWDGIVLKATDFIESMTSNG
ncbi:MAG: nucleotidyl transferase AbiEii/AbiGii toxin family protein [Elusimicrobia bacterium]|nr:nucleotidyl transferase AbiEii/AbiGii toxin family protein [Elusimicrobiota bacterium]